ncbi:mitochondrial carrier domain-containing protein [Entophlyctis helioformis]|nr:mitochondrial carrier domain-containing protein [Entophlyctis helioformis]
MVQQPQQPQQQPQQQQPQQQQQQQKEEADEFPQLPPLPNATPALANLPGFLAGFARALAANAGVLAVNFAKGTLQWWFRVPVKLFRPYAINPWLVFRSMAAVQGKPFNVQFVRDILRTEGASFFRKNALPLFVANAIVGGCLFNIYAFTLGRLSSMSMQRSIQHGQSKDSQLPGGADHPSHTYWHAFLAGGVGGAGQSVLATPLDAIQRMLEPKSMVEHRHRGIRHATRKALSESLSTHSFWHTRLLHLYRNFGFNAGRDAAGFALFFGVFEAMQHTGHSLVERLCDGGPGGQLPKHGDAGSQMQGQAHGPLQTQHKHRSVLRILLDACVVVGAGATAGAAYQTAVYPLDRLSEAITAKPAPQEPQHEQHQHRHHTHTRTAGADQQPPHGTAASRSHAPPQPRLTWIAAARLVRQHGIGRYYAGIAPQLVRAMPPSAAALFVYELTRDQLQ